MAFDWYKKTNGYVEIQIEGYFAERFINLAQHRFVTMWDIIHYSDGRIIAKVIPNDFKRLRNIAHVTGCRIRIVRKRGLPFLMFRYRNRKFFLIIVLTGMIVINLYNSRIWSVDITGNFTIPIEELREQLREENLKVSSKKRDIDIEQLKINMALKRNDLAWIGVKIEGTKAFVEIVQKVMPEIEELAGIPCNIVAKKEGVILKINVKDGVAKVKKDDLVQKGQILISGIISSQQTPDRYVHADGDVYAKAWYTSKVKIPYNREIVNKTGKIEKKCRIKIGKYQINFSNNDTKFEKYDTIYVEKQFKVLNSWILPIEVYETIYEEVEVETINLTAIQAESIAKNDAMNNALQMLPSDATDIENFVVVRNYAEGVEAEVTIECVEKIGTKEKLGG